MKSGIKLFPNPLPDTIGIGIRVGKLEQFHLKSGKGTRSLWPLASIESWFQGTDFAAHAQSKAVGWALPTTCTAVAVELKVPTIGKNSSLELSEAGFCFHERI